jgi:L-lactate dehydrogenase complex protein LldG
VSVARNEVLARIRAALADVPAGERPADVPVERAYRDAGGIAKAAEAGRGGPDGGVPAGGAELVELLAERVADYKATVHLVGPDEVAATLTAACAARGARRLVVPDGLPEGWRPDGVELVADDGLDNAALDAIDGALTGCALAIAETGTIVLDHGPGQGRRAISLVPDWHLCVVEVSQVVDNVPAAVAALHGAATAGRPITLISGPSATSDIELSRVEGVHGPRTLEVLIVG